MLPLLATLGCQPREQAPPIQQRAEAQSQARARAPVSDTRQDPLEVSIAKCKVVVAGDQRRCYLGKSHTLLLWLPERAGVEITVRHEGQPLAARTLLDARDQVLAVDVPGPGRLELEYAGGRWSTLLVESSAQYYEAWKHLSAAFETGGFDAAEAAFDTIEADTVSPDERALLGCLRAQFAYPSGRLDSFAPSLDDSPALGCRGLAHLLASYAALFDHPDLSSAERHIEAALEVGREDFSIGVSALYCRAGLALASGQIDEGIDILERVVALSAQLDDPAQLSSAQVSLAVALARLGRFDEAEQLVTQIEAQLADTGTRTETVAEILDSVAWSQLLQREDDPGAKDPSPTLERLALLYASLERPDDEARTQLHLALAAVQAGDASRAVATLAQIQQAQLTPLDLVWFELVATRAASLQGRFEAANEPLERAKLYAALHEDPELEWYVTTAEAALARDAGESERSLAAYQRAALLADALALSVPGSAGRSMVVSSRSHVDAEHVALLLELERPSEAVCIAAGTRARHLRALWARLRPPLPGPLKLEYQDLLSRHAERREAIESELAAAWSLSTTKLEQLRDRLRSEGEQADAILERATALLERQAPRWSCEQILPHDPGTGLLTMAASPDRTQWWFMLSRPGAPPAVVGLPANESPELLAARALAEFDPALEGVESLTIVPIAEFVAVDFHTHLLASDEADPLQIRYSLGLGQRETSGSEQAHDNTQAAVVAGANNLEAVDAETRSVARQLEARGWQVRPTWAPSEAPQPALLHFAGHGHYEGLGGWQSYIELPEHGRLSATKLVAEQRSPNFVVLGACSAGRTNSQVVDGGMNLAAAFLLAGAQLVIAPSGPVEDQTALELGERLYAGEGPFDAELLSRSLGVLQREELAGPASTRPAGPRSRLRWRVWVP